MQANEFKVGLKVTVTDGYYKNSMMGLQGVVKAYYPAGGAWLVEFDGWEGGHDGFAQRMSPLVKRDGAKSRWFLHPADLSAITATTPTIASDLRLTPQAKTVLSHLKRRNHISPAEAERVYGISRLASCIHEIRQRAGYPVKTTVKRDDAGHKYANYQLLAA